MYNEKELSDDYPIHPGYLYVVAGKVWRSDISTTVGALKRRLEVVSVMNCDIAGRNLWDGAL